MHVLSNTSPSCSVRHASVQYIWGFHRRSSQLRGSWGWRQGVWVKKSWDGMVYDDTKPGWWFGTCFFLKLFFPYMGNNHPKWLSFFQRGWNHQPETIEMDDNWGVYPDGLDTCMNYKWKYVCRWLSVNCQSKVGYECRYSEDALRLVQPNVISSPTNAVLAFVDHVVIIPRNSNMAMENPQLFDDCAMNLHL